MNSKPLTRQEVLAVVWSKKYGTRSDFRGRNLRGIDLSYGNLSYIDLQQADLCNANLRNVNLYKANLRNANLQYANLRYATLQHSHLFNADLFNANLQNANLQCVNLQDAILQYANLSGANLSGAKGLLDSSTFLTKHFASDDFGIIVYKIFGRMFYSKPDYWQEKIGAVIEEVVDSCRTIDCGCGINCATWEWCQILKAWRDTRMIDTRIWKCRIRWIDLADVVVPYNTDGKIRCGRLELIERVGM